MSYSSTDGPSEGSKAWDSVIFLNTYEKEPPFLYRSVAICLKPASHLSFSRWRKSSGLWFGWVTLWNVLERMIQGNTYSQWLLQRLRWALILTHRSEHPEFLNLWGIWVGNDLCDFSPRRLRTVVSLGMGFSETRVATLMKRFQMHLQKAFFSYRNSPL